MYQQNDDEYGDEGDGDDDKNDGLNALVKSLLLYDNLYRICNM